VSRAFALATIGLLCSLVTSPISAQVNAPTLFDEEGDAIGAADEGEADDDSVADGPSADDGEPEPDPLPEDIDPSVPRQADDDPVAPRPPPGAGRVDPAPRPAARPPGNAQRPPGGVKEAADDAAPEVEAAGSEAAGFGAVEAVGDAYAPILQLWEQRRQALRSHKAVEANAHLGAISAQLRRLGGGGPLGSSLRDIGVALAREAARAIEERDALRALGLSEVATELAGDVPYVQLTLARARFATNRGDIGGVFKALRASARVAVEEIGSAAALALSGVLFVTFTLILATFLVVLALFIRSAGLLVHDVRHLMPRGVSTMQAAVLVAVLALLPILFKLGPLFTALWLLLLAWSYLSRRERGAVAALWTLNVLLPFLVVVGAHLIGPDVREAAQVYRATRDVGMRDARGFLATLSARRPDDPVLLGARAILEKRDGELDAAKAGLRRALAKAPDQAWLHNNLGNVLALQGDLDGALAAYGRAVDLEPSSIEAHFNTANLYFRHKRTSQARAAAATAMNLDEGAFKRFQQLSEGARGASHNQTVVDINVPAALLWLGALERGRDVERYQRQAAAYLFFGLPPLYMAGAVLGGLLLLLMMGRMGSKLRPSHACPRCGNASCVRCDAEIPTHDLCGQCYHAFLAPSRAIDANLKIRKEIEVRRYRSRRDTMRRFGSLVIAGIGHVVGGAPLRGVISVLVYAALVTGALLLWITSPMSISIGVGFPLARVIALVVVGLLLYAWSFLSALRLEG